MLYKQCKIQYDFGSYEVCWIPENFAHKRKSLLIDWDDGVSRLCVVEEVYDDVRLPKAMVEINRTYPLRKVTDI